MGAAPTCVFVGDESLTLQCAEYARDNGLVVETVASRSRRVLQQARASGFETIDTTAGLGAALEGRDIDVLLSVANLRIVPRRVLQRTRLAINFHDGPLPAYAGLNVPNWAILNGETQHGVTWHVMTADVDAGDIVAAESFPIRADETGFSLNASCFEAGLASFPRVAAMIAAGRLDTTAQPARHERLYLRRDRPARLIDLTQPAVELDRLVRALSVGHRAANRIGLPLLLHRGHVHVVDALQLIGEASGAPAGTVVDGGPSPRVATATDDVVLTLGELDGGPIEHPPTTGDRVVAPEARVVTLFAAADRHAADHEDAWAERLALHPSPLPAAPGEDDGWGMAGIDAAGIDTPDAVAVVAAWLARLNGTATVAFGCERDDAARHRDELRGLLGQPVAAMRVDADASFADLRAATIAELDTLERLGAPLADLHVRRPDLAGHQAAPALVVRIGTGPIDGELDALDPETLAVARIDEQTRTLRLYHRRAAIADAAAARFAEQIGRLAAAAAGATPIGAVSMIGPAEQAELDRLNATAIEYDRAQTIDSAFRACVAGGPHAPAVSSGGTTLSYAELDARVDALAAELAARGAARGDRVGIALHRGIDMVAAVLATLRAGAAYVPLDPTYPIERLSFMIEDSGLRLLVATGDAASRLATAGVDIVDPSASGQAPPAPLQTPAADDLAYVIYTSGSTGRPKGVMLTHANVTNFFVAMDAVIDHDEPGVWLAVTSLSFDISVLELLWTLTRGFHVVVKRSSGLAPANAPARPVTLSLFYFAAGSGAPEGYRLLLEGARFADRAGFEAVWTPERHFHAFGGAYPNPSVTSAALAVATERIAIRAGSVVLPLHAEARVAEEWAVVDNLSNGRVGISFAAGWQPNDFVLNPSGYERAREDLPTRIDTVRALWRGDTVTQTGPTGEPVEVRTLPRPVQPDLPVWLTSAGSPSTFERAGTLGTNILTHLLGQSIDDLAANVRRYRDAWRAADHAGEGRVTLMLHTYLADDEQTAKSVAKGPMKDYLGASASLIKNMASAFPTFAGSGKDADEAFNSLTADQLSELLDFAATRYLEDSGLFGTAGQAASMIDRLATVGVDEVACLIDFGVGTDDVIASFGQLARTKELVDARTTTLEPADEESVASLARQYGVTHLQCTPSLAAMLAADPNDRRALASIGHVMLGGEAMPTALAAELRKLLPRRFTNMYGPTETTIWSLVHEIDEPPTGTVPIGRPIANTTVHVLDPNGMPAPIGVFGELCIGGEGVARGYHNRPELTAERFADRLGDGVLYATGDIARIGRSGVVEFAGRADNQIKIRGHRIELGEIEAVLDAHPTVAQSVVAVRGDGVDPTLVAFAIPAAGATIDATVLRKHVADALPQAMVPATVVAIDEMPLTPNGKVDRKALPDVTVAPVEVAADAMPAGDVEQRVAAVWEHALGRPVGRDDNFFEIGGHSLLAVRLFREFSEVEQMQVALTDIFRYPTVRTFAAYVEAAQDGGTASAASDAAPQLDGSQRGARRRQALARRGGDSSGR